MSYRADITAGPPHPTHPQQTGYTMNQPIANNPDGKDTPTYSYPNQQPAQYPEYPQQQGNPYMQPAVPGGQYQPDQQKYSQQQYGVAPQSTTVMPQGNAAQPQVIVVGCPQGQHFYRTHYGTCGIIAAILLFPIGLIFLFLDQETRCDRCGAPA